MSTTAETKAINFAIDWGYIHHLRDPKSHPYKLDPDLREALISETNWTLVEEMPALAKGEAEAIGMGKQVCSRCGGKRTVPLWAVGSTTGLRAPWKTPCNCRDFQRFFPKWNAMVPFAYRSFRLHNLAPTANSIVPMGIQQGIIDDLKTYPDRSCLFVGPPATSKTVYSTCLFEHALREWVFKQGVELGGLPEACWYVSAYDLLQQAHDYAIQRETTYTDEFGNNVRREAKEPLVTVGKIRKAVAAGLKPHLFIEELDKVPTVTEFRGSTIFELIKEMDAQGGQIVVTANKTAKELEQMYSVKDGAALVRRLTHKNATGDGMTFDLFNAGTSSLTVNEATTTNH
jgi:hypothetical protein